MSDIAGAILLILIFALSQGKCTITVDGTPHTIKIDYVRE